MKWIKHKSNTELAIMKYVHKGFSNEKIAARIGRPLTPELTGRIEEIRKEPFYD